MASIMECKQSHFGAVIGGSQALLEHRGDYIVLMCPATLGSVSFTVDKRTKKHELAEISRRAVNEQVVQSTENVTLKTGETKKIGPVNEQYFSKHDYPALDEYIDDQNIVITLVTALKPDGSTDPVNTDPIAYVWHVYDKDGKELATGTEADKDPAIVAAKASKEAGRATWTVTDSFGNINASGNFDGTGDFPWWIVGVAIAAAVAIVVIWYFYRRRASIPGPAAPAVDCPPPCGTGGK